MKPRVTLRKALADKQLLGGILNGSSWRAWRILLMAAVGEQLHDDEREVFQKLTLRDHEPCKRIDELVCVIGRRGGKSRAISVLATYVAGLCTHPSLVPGETGVVLIISADKRQASVCLDYIHSNFTESPLLSQLVVNRTQTDLNLSNKVSIRVRSSDFRRLRGPTYLAVIGDEAAFWRSDDGSSNPDVEILNSVRPGLSTTNGPLMLISSPYGRRGELYRLYQQNYRPDGDPAILVAKGTSRDLNPNLSQAIVDRALERDPASARAEYLAEFRTDIESFISREAVDQAIRPGRLELPSLLDVHYTAFVDPSGGSGDSFTLAICHVEGSRVVLDVVRERHPPFSPAAVVAEFSTTLKDYNIHAVRGDRYGGLFPRELFAVHSINYKVCDQTKSDLYQALLPLLNSGQVDLLDQKRLIVQLCGLERRTARGGKDSIDHAPNAHDDIINAVAGAIVTARRPVQNVPIVGPVIVTSGVREIPGGSTPPLPPGGPSTPLPYFVNPTRH
jgi:hypothetical protein